MLSLEQAFNDPNISPFIYTLLIWVGAIGLAVPMGLFVSGQTVEGSLVVITGASQGIGEAVAKLLAIRGARVVLLARNLDKLKAVKAAIDKESGKDKAFIFKCDCSNGEDVDRVAKEIKLIGTPDVIINNAGAGRWRYLAEMSAKEVVECFNAPPIAAALVTRAFMLDMLERNSGSIINVLSPAALVPFPGATAYNVARWALRGLTEALEADFYGTKIKVQDVYLGEVSSEYFNTNDGSHERVPQGSSPVTAHQAARAIVRAIESGRRCSYYPFTLRIYFRWYAWICKHYVGYPGMKFREKAFPQIKKGAAKTD